MSKNITLARIAALISSIGSRQMSVEPDVDSVTGHRMWGGKDSSGSWYKFLGKDKPIRVSALNLLGFPAGSLKTDALGNVSVGATNIDDFNNVIKFNADRTGVVDAVSSFEAADAANGLTLVPKGIYLLSSQPALTGPLYLLPGAVLIWSGFQLEVSIVLTKGDLTKHFDCVVADLPKLTTESISPEHFGAIFNGSDDQPAVQKAFSTGIHVKMYNEYSLGSGVTLETLRQHIEFMGPNAKLTALTPTFSILQILAQEVKLSAPNVVNGLIGIHVGSSITKANLPFITFPRFMKCQTQLYIEHGNSGQMYGGFANGKGDESGDIGIHFNGEAQNSNGWTIHGLRVFDCSICLFMEGDSGSNRYCDDNDIMITGEDFDVFGVRIAGGIRNKIVGYFETDPLFPNARNISDITGSRSNLCNLRGTSSIDENGSFNGMYGGTAPKYHLTEDWKLRELEFDLTGNITTDLITANKIIKLTNTDATHFVNLNKIDSHDIGVKTFLYCPASNTNKITIKLLDPATFTWLETASVNFNIFANGLDQFFEIVKLSSTRYSIKEISSNEIMPAQLTKTFGASTSHSLATMRTNSVHDIDNTSGVTAILTLTNPDFVPIGFMGYFINQTNDITKLLLDGADKFISGINTYNLNPGFGATIRKIGTGLWQWQDWEKSDSGASVQTITGSTGDIDSSVVNVEYTNTGSVALNAALASDSYDSVNKIGKLFIIHDTDCNSLTNNIVISRVGSDTFTTTTPGQTSVTLQKNGGWVALQAIGNNKFKVYGDYV